MTAAEFTPTGWYAAYSAKIRNGVDRRNVEAFDAEGYPLVVDEAVGALTRAQNLPGFERLEQTSRVVAAAAAAPGWTMRYPGHGTDPAWSAPVALWLIDQHGAAVPVPWIGGQPYLEGETEDDAVIAYDPDTPTAASGV